MRPFLSVAAGTAAICMMACAHLGLGSKKPSENHLVTSEERLAAIRRATVWEPTAVPTMNLRVGPRVPGAFAPAALVSCNYVHKPMGGNSPKFACLIPPNDELKVKYGRENGEVFAEVAASRLFWALGFYAERMFPVRVVCQGCPANIRDTEYASVQRKLPGSDLHTKDMVGWAWRELDLVDVAAGGASRAQRDALKLLAVFVQHTDSKPDQQRLICEGKHKSSTHDEPCSRIVMMVHDLGQTFGSANLFNRDVVGSVNLSEWSRMSIWKDSTRCVANLPQSQTGTLDNPLIIEEGRRFLADLLEQLTDTQLYDLFDVARFADRVRPDGTREATSVNAWVSAFKQKRDEIVRRTCPA